MLLRNKMVTVMAYWEERKLGNLKPRSARLVLKERSTGTWARVTDCSDHVEGPSDVRTSETPLRG